METHTRLSRHNKFISAENITILSVSSDDYLHALSTLKDLYDFLHIFYVKNNPNPLSLDTDRIF